MRKSSNGQVMMTDLAASLMLFLLILSSVLSIWANNQSNLEKKIEFNDMQENASYALNYLIKNPGQPDNWYKTDLNSVTTIGLAKRDRVLDNERLIAFSNLNETQEKYSKSKELLLAGNYDYFFELLDTGITAGMPAPENAYKMAVTRVVVWEGNEYAARFTVWRLRE